MTVVNIKGHEINVIPVRDSFTRRAVQFKNKIISALRNLGLTEDDIEVYIEPVAIKKAKASVSWYFNGHYLHYSYNSCHKFVDNLFVVLRVIELEIDSLINKQKTVEEFIREFSEDEDVEKQRKEARAVLGLKHDVVDLEVIDKAYKELAKQHHPDKGGDDAEFKAINKAHKILRRELQ